MNPKTYSPDARWRYRYRGNQAGVEDRVGGLTLSWEVNGDPISDDYLPEETDARELWRLWIDRFSATSYDPKLGYPWVPIYWFVAGRGEGTFETAPFQQKRVEFITEDFLTHYSLPEDPATGEFVNWLRLPVEDKLWRPKQADKGGFIQEASGWKPHALQPAINLCVFEAAGLSIPDHP